MLPGFFAQRVAPFYRTLTTTTDCQTSLLVESDGYVLGELREAYPRVQRHRCQRPQKRLCRRRAAVGVGLITCGEEELVRQVHTLFGRSAQVLYELQVQEEKECGRKCGESKKGEQSEEKRSHEHGQVDKWMV